MPKVNNYISMILISSIIEARKEILHNMIKVKVRGVFKTLVRHLRWGSIFAKNFILDV